MTGPDWRLAHRPAHAHGTEYSSRWASGGPVRERRRTAIRLTLWLLAIALGLALGAAAIALI